MMVCMRASSALSVLSLHLGAPTKQLGQMIFLCRIEMRGDDETEPAVGRHCGEQLLQRFQPARPLDPVSREVGGVLLQKSPW